MSELARNKQKDALKHLLEEVLGLPEDSNVWKGLAHHAGGVDQLYIYMVTTMDYDDLRGLGYKPTPKAATPSVPKGMASQLINFPKMYWELDQAGNTMVDEILTFTMEEFEKYEHDLRKRQVMNHNFEVIPPPRQQLPSHPVECQCMKRFNVKKHGRPCALWVSGLPLMETTGMRQNSSRKRQITMPDDCCNLGCPRWIPSSSITAPTLRQ